MPIDDVIEDIMDIFRQINQVNTRPRLENNLLTAKWLYCPKGFFLLDLHGEKQK